MATNKAILIGNVGAKPKLTRLDNGKSVTNFSLATHDRYKDKESGKTRTSTEWHNIVAWGALAELLTDNLKQGSFIQIEGKIVTTPWTDSDNNRRTKTEIIVSDFEFLDAVKNRTNK